MILRKPYALLIQYFQRIHLLLILLSAYVFYKITYLRNFVADFLQTESYNAYYEPISDYINVSVILVILAVVIISIVLIVLLHYKKKPWRIYLIPIIEYAVMLVVLLYIRSYFNSYNELSTITPIMAGRDFLNIIYFPQFIIFIIFGIRFLGIDLKKFGFKEDEEYLDIKEEDREEFEVNIEFDKDKITRNIRKFIRNAKYVYFEHRLICNSIIVILFISITGYTYYYFGILNRTYREGNTFSANYYDITVNSSYLTNRDSHGDIISDNTDYLVVNVTVKNNSSKRNINLDRFRIMNRSEEFHYATRLYNNFQDLGKAYDNRDLDTNSSVTFILVYKVPKDLNEDKYVLYYPDVTNGVLVKKIKLNVRDVRELETKEELQITETLTFPSGNTFTVTDFLITNETTYSRYACKNNNCGMMELPLSSNNKILEISFISNNFTGEFFIDFSNIYAKIKYEDNDGKVHSITADSLLDNYNGNYAYYSLPNDIKDDGILDLIFTFRNEQYIYHLN